MKNNLNIGQKFLSFHLGEKNIAVIAVQDITEVLQLSLSEICSVPQMPSYVSGICNWRGEILWLVDLEEMFGYLALAKEAHHLSKISAVIIHHEGKYLGLLVRRLLDIEWFDIEQLKPTTTELFSPEISQLLHGYFINDKEEMIINLNSAAIFQAPIWAIHH